MWKAVGCVAVAVLVGGCAEGRHSAEGPGPYDRGDGGGSHYDSCRDDAAAGTVVGGVAGGVIGNQFGRGSGNAAATVGGVILGAIVGNAIARDACRNERADAYYYNHTYYDAFDQPTYGRRYEWRNPNNGHYGYVTPRRAYSDGSRYGYHGECREFTQVIYVDDYHTEEAVGVACRQDDGTWRIVQQ
jgi:surface antigen